MIRKSFAEFLLTEAIEVQAEVNIDMTIAEKKAFQKAVEKEGFDISFGKNHYAEVARINGNKAKIVKFLKKYGYYEDEIAFRK